MSQEVPERFPAPWAWSPSVQRTCWDTCWSGGERLADVTGCGLGGGGGGIKKERVPCVICFVASAVHLPSALPSPQESLAKCDSYVSALIGATNPRAVPTVGVWQIGEVGEMPWRFQV